MADADHPAAVQTKELLLEQNRQLAAKARKRKRARARVGGVLREGA